MPFKIFGAALAAAACAALGFYFAWRESFRIQDLRELKKALLILASEIEYAAAPLPEAMANLAPRVEKPVSLIFSDFSRKLSNSGGETAYRMWESAVAEHKSKSCLADEDIEALTAFGKTLGYLDKRMQLNAIAFANRYIDDKTAELQLSCDRNRRMYRSLGLIGGVLVAVVLW
ncbi:MAG: stage III sporulation protein AB [Clostridiales bacterium]|jgi:stage III sporulation protein AB|nr:stage III sporulation protein AB [Clostridiales bacterium]